jgi:undecaprenyl-phosphate galactose phosphotransferase
MLNSEIVIPMRSSERRIASFAKRALDVSAASLLLLVILPLLLLTAIAVALDGGPVLYLSERVGANGIPFKCLKFRTMMLGADCCLDEYLGHHPSAREEWMQNRKLAFDPRVSYVGRLLRRSSIDEFPQLINVIKGDMSLVGPRPVTQAELDAYFGLQGELYKSVRPGITGLWQVSGRNDVDYASRVALDARYVRNWNIIFDILILCKTPHAVLSRRCAR